MEIKTYLNERKLLVEAALVRFIPKPAGTFKSHLETMRYSLFVGGKRLRPILCLAAVDAVSDNDAGLRERALPLACALECIHTYSLIHDDLPAMDNDDLRRGKPTNHKVFGEAAAILAGDGLLTLAFELLSDPACAEVPAAVRLRIIHTIAQGAGSNGMVGGQSLDMLYEGKKSNYEILRTIHRSKTGALITASILSGALLAEANAAQEAALLHYGEQVGLAFQIADDILDATSNTETLGKTAGSDLAAQKTTYPLLFGLEDSRRRAQEASQEATHALDGFNDAAKPLRSLANYIVGRTH